MSSLPTDPLFDAFCRQAHVPGLVYGLVAQGRLQHLGAFGVQDLASATPVHVRSVFRIASMTKAFTALTVLALRDAGLLALEDAVAQYVPELADWRYPTRDAEPVRIRDLLGHTAGFVTDDPWGDRQSPLPDAEFSRLLRCGGAFTRAPGLAYEYSNLGYALLGRVITQVSGADYASTMARLLFEPLGLEDTGFLAEQVPPQRLAVGYRHTDGQWQAEPVLGHGAFGAMGGLHTTAHDYARWLAFLLDAWPARDDPDGGPVRRATVRQMALPMSFPRLRARPAFLPQARPAATGTGAAATDPRAAAAACYGMGLDVVCDPLLGLTLSHSGGYPGYGSHMLLFPERGVGLFAFANRTYAGPAAALWSAALQLDADGLLGAERVLPVSAQLAAAYVQVQAVYAARRIEAAGDGLAMNMLLDRSADGWARDLAALHALLGDCLQVGPLRAEGSLSGSFDWVCQRGRLQGVLQLAPLAGGIQTLRLSPLPEMA